MYPTRVRRFFASRVGILAAAMTGFAVGAAGFAAAQQASPSSESAPVASSTIESTIDSTIATTVTSVDDGPTTSIDDGDDDLSDDGSPVTSVDDDQGPATTIDDEEGPNTTVDDDDDGATTTTVVASSSLPAPFSTTYVSAGGSISVTWSGTAFTLNSVSPSAGFDVDIEEQSWDRIRVDFDGDDVEARIEVRLDDGQLRLRID